MIVVTFLISTNPSDKVMLDVTQICSIRIRNNDSDVNGAIGDSANIELDILLKSGTHLIITATNDTLINVAIATRLMEDISVELVLPSPATATRIEKSISSIKSLGYNLSAKYQ